MFKFMPGLEAFVESASPKRKSMLVNKEVGLLCLWKSHNRIYWNRNTKTEIHQHAEQLYLYLWDSD